MPDQTFVISRPPEAEPLEVWELKALIKSLRWKYEWCVLELPKRKGCLNVIFDMVDKQAKDDRLWFQAETAAEAYLQEGLRKLHAAIEERREKCGR